MINRRTIVRSLRPARWALTIGLFVVVIVCLLPVWWSLVSSFKGKDELYQAVPSLIVRHPTLANYQWVLATRGAQRMPLALLNSLKVTVGSVALTVFLASMAGYAFARLNFAGRDQLFYGFIFAMFIPRAGGLMAQYELFSFLHLRNSHLGLILHFASGLSVPIFIMRQTYLNMPREIEESAIIDGASNWQLFWRIAIPMGVAGMTVVGLFNFIYAWGDYLFTYTMIDSDELSTAAILVAKMRVVSSPQFSSGQFATYGAECASEVLAMSPVVIVTILMQRWFVRGLTEGVLKM